MKLNTIKALDKKSAISLVGKRIHFTWHNRLDNTIWTLPAKVLSYHDNKLKVYILDIFYENIDYEKEAENTVDIDIKNISDVFVFHEYTKNFWTLFDSIKEKDLNNTIYKLEDIFGNTIKTKILKDDVLAITILIDDEKYDYPTYFVKSIKVCNR